MNAYHNYGRWVVQCPSPLCVGALRLWAGQTPVACDCHDQDLCQHGETCGEVFTVEWPLWIAEIEAVMAERPIPNRNWYPHETLADLLAENVEHGL